jgi:hypothetical protein
MHIPNPFRGRQPGANAQTAAAPPVAQPNTQPQYPHTGPLAGNGTPSMQTSKADSELSLVNYSPEELVQHVDQSLSRVQFGWSWNIKFMENFSEVWSLVGPIILLAGTIGEVFLVLWLRQKTQNLVAGLSIVAVAMVLEGTFLTVSYKSATIRNRAERRATGPNQIDKKKLRRQLLFWVALAFGVCATQIIFIKAQTNADGIGEIGVWAFAILRSVFTLVADGYTAFAHEEKPTTGERALEEQQERAKLAESFLRQKKTEITIFNEGILEVREALNEAQIKDVKMTTSLEVEKLQAQSQIDALKAQQEQATRMMNTNISIMRALFDPEMADADRQKLLTLMQGMASMYHALPQPKVNTITEEDV